MGEEADFTLKLIDQMTAPSKQIVNQLQNMNNTLYESFKAITALHKVQKDPAPKTFADKLRGAVGTFHDMFEIARDVGGEILSLGKHFVAAGAEEEAFVRRLELLTGSKHVAEEIAASMDSIRPAFKGTEAEMKALVAQTLKLGFGADELKNILPLAFDVKAISGTQEGAEKFLQIMNKAAVGVKLGAKDTKFFRDQLGLVIPEGIKGAEAMKKIGDAITAKKGGIAGAASVQAAQSLDNLITRFSELPHKMFEAFAATPGFEKLRQAVSDVLDKVGPGSALFQQFSAVLADLVGGAITGLIAALPTILSGLGKLITFVTKNSELLPGLAIGVIALNAAMSANPVGVIIAGLVAWVKVISDIRSNIHLLADELKDFFKFKEPGARKTWEDYSQPITTALKGVPEMAKATGENTGTAIKTGFANTTETHSPSKVFERLGKGITGGLDKGIGEPAAVPLPNMTEPAGGGGNSTRIGGVTIQVNVDGSAGDPGTLAAKLAELLPGALAGAFENLALQQGAA